MNKKVVVIGGGIAGMESASYLVAMGYDVTLLEKEAKLGGHLLNWERLFPTKRLGKEVLEFLNAGVDNKVTISTENSVKSIRKINNHFEIETEKGQQFEAHAILICTGYDLFDARKKEEYGYGIYDNVITSADLEILFSTGKEIATKNGEKPKRIGIVHCVGSRDEKVGNTYCSKVCCVTAVKQAIEIKERLPEAEIFCFYMDLRMFGMRFESLYKEAQEKWGVNFIRGRLSEACENSDETIVVKVEDTLAGKPLKMTVDLLVLMVGFVPSEGSKKIGKLLDLQFNEFGFLNVADEHTMTNVANITGVFLAGAATGAKSITNTITDARAAAAKVACFLTSTYQS